MTWTNALVILTIFFATISDFTVVCGNQQFFYKNANTMPRNIRKPAYAVSFEDFFQKASKQVPRLGRRNFDLNEQYYKGNSELFRDSVPNVKVFKRFDAGKETPWSDLADKVEYYPELMMSPELLATASLKDLEDYGYNVPQKRSRIIKNKELPEIRLQPTV